MAAAGYHVKVTNKNDFPIEDRYDGLRFVIPAMGEAKIPYDAASHIFGADFKPGSGGHVDPQLREKIFRHVQRRWGWNRSDMLEKSREFFDRLEFKLIALKLVETTAEDKDNLPAPRGTAADRKQNAQGGRGQGGRGQGDEDPDLLHNENNKGAA